MKENNKLFATRSLEKAISVLFIFLAISCSNQEDVSPELSQSSGTQLAFIEYSNDHFGKWTTKFNYSPEDLLTSIEDDLSRRRYEMEYQNGKLIQYETYEIDTEKLIFRDSIIYHSNDRIKAIYLFAVNSDLYNIYEYEYDNEDRLYKRSTYLVATKEYKRYEIFYWEEENITKVEHYNNKDEILYEYFYEYDDKLNFLSQNPTLIRDPINWSKNNIALFDWNDKLGNIELTCSTCQYEYEYNLDDFPISAKTNWGLEITLTYE